MKRIASTFILSALTTVLLAQEAEDKKSEEPKTHFAVNIVHNSVAGYFPVFLGRVETPKNIDLTFYNIFWTNATFGNAATGGDLWLEQGIGAGFHLMDNKMFLNPSLGITHGKFLSGANTTLLAEGVVPSTLLLYHTNRLEFEGYISYYKSVRKGEAGQRDFLLNWVFAGVKANKILSLGFYQEQFRLTYNPAHEVTGDIYHNLGGYFKLNFVHGINTRFGMGKNLKTDLNSADEFYKASVFIPFG